MSLCMFLTWNGISKIKVLWKKIWEGGREGKRERESERGEGSKGLSGIGGLERIQY